MTIASFLTQLLELAIAVALAPLLVGWVNMCRAWLQNKSAPSLLLPYRTIRKLFMKDAVVAQSASPIFRTTPYIVFGAMCCAAAIVPSLATDLPFAQAADAIALVGLFALARVFIALAAMDIGTAFGALGARREMFVGFLAEPALLMVLFTASLISGSTSLPTIVEALANRELAIYPSLAFAGVAFTMVSLAENARIPIDNPSTHLELTMIHEAMILEYSARHLALLEWASALKLFNYSCIGLALFFPFGIAAAGDWLALIGAAPALIFKLAIGGVALAFIETLSAKLRIFRAPEFLGTAFLLAVLAMLAQRRVLTLIDLFAAQGLALAISTGIVAYGTSQAHLYFSAGLTFALKVILLPWILHRLIRRLDVRWEFEGLINIPTTMLIGIVLVVFSFNLALPISQLASTVTRSTLGIAMASVMLSFLMMITRRKAIPQVIGFLAMENGLFFAATSATYGMPMVVELGIALDVLVGMLILGVFFFQIREQFDSLDLRHLEKLRETDQ